MQEKRISKFRTSFSEIPSFMGSPVLSSQISYDILFLDQRRVERKRKRRMVRRRREKQMITRLKYLPQLPEMVKSILNFCLNVYFSASTVQRSQIKPTLNPRQERKTRERERTKILN